MPTSANLVIGWGVSNGELVDATATRQATVSRFDVVGGSSGVSSVGGIVPAGGNPFKVTQMATPGLGVTVNKGMIVVPGNSTDVPPYAAVLTSNVDLSPMSAGHATNPRIDLVIVKIYNSGNDTSAGTVEILEGAPAPSPLRPDLPVGNYHCITIATIAVAANASSIVNANISVAQSDTWSAASSDAGWTAAPGGCVVQAGLVAMSSTRRAAWAARLAPYTPWYDPTARVGGYTDGTDLVPTTIRKLYQIQSASTVSANSTSPVIIANSSSLSIFGGTRRIRVVGSGILTTDRNSDGGWLSVRPYLAGTGTLSGMSAATYTRAQIRVWGITTGTADIHTQVPFTINQTFEATSGTCSVRLEFLVEVSGGTGSGTTAYCKFGSLLVEDVGPA